MADPLADPQDVAVLLGRSFTDTEERQAEARIVYASALVRAQFPNIDADIAAGVIDRDVVSVVVVSMVNRAFIAPADGVAQTSETTGPFSRSQSFANPLGNVFLTAGELLLLRGYRARARSIRYC